MIHSHEITIKLGGAEFDCLVQYEYEPAEGDGWHNPRFEECVRILDVTLACGVEIDHAPFEQDLKQEILDAIADERREYAEGKAEYLYDQWCDRKGWAL